MGRKSGSNRSKPKPWMTVEKILDMNVYDCVNGKKYLCLADYFTEKENERQDSDATQEPVHVKYTYRKELNNGPWQRKKILDYIRDGLDICEKTKASWQSDKPSVLIEPCPEKSSGQWYSVASKKEALERFEQAIAHTGFSILQEKEKSAQMSIVKDDGLEEARLVAGIQELKRKWNVPRFKRA